MTSYTSLLEFRLPVGALRNPDNATDVLRIIGNELAPLDFQENQPNHACNSSQPTTWFYFSSSQSRKHAIVCSYPNTGLVTLDIHQFSGESKPTISNQTIEELEKKICKKLKCVQSKSLPAIRRGDGVQRYFPTTFNSLIEYDFDECVFEADSPFQNIKIMHSPQYGNMLILDDDPNLAESDLAYTHAITGHGREDYKNKTVLILGGGDGGILHELRKEGPKLITMVDNGIVVDAAKKHLRGICYDSLDQLTGDNYEVLIADCIPYLKKYIEEGRMFDYVINDLTAIPVTTSPVGEMWDFLRLILDMSMKVLAPSGKYYTQGNGFNMVEALAMYEEQLGKLEVSVDFRKENVFVPSYLEKWVFYEIWKKPVDKNSQNSGVV